MKQNDQNEGSLPSENALHVTRNPSNAFAGTAGVRTETFCALLRRRFGGPDQLEPFLGSWFARGRARRERERIQSIEPLRLSSWKTCGGAGAAGGQALIFAQLISIYFEADFPDLGPAAEVTVG